MFSGAQIEYARSVVDRSALEFVGGMQSLFVPADLKPYLQILQPTLFFIAIPNPVLNFGESRFPGAVKSRIPQRFLAKSRIACVADSYKHPCTQSAQ